MDAKDVVTIAKMMSRSKTIAVHMETINHCRLTRSTLRERVEVEGLGEKVLIPADGEILTF